MSDPDRVNPPPFDDLRAAEDDARREAASTDERAKLQTGAVRRLVDRGGRRYGLAAIAFSIAFNLLLGYLVFDLTGRVELGEVLYAQEQVQNAAALDSLGRANAALRSRGQPEVPAPPGRDPQEAVAAAVTARVLAQLPAAPSAEQVAQLVGPAALSQVTGPTADQLAVRVADYFRVNAESLRGEPGEPGMGPTRDQIRAAVDAAYAANPPAPGRDGADGTNGRDGIPGISVVGQSFVRNGQGACVSRVEYSDGRVEQRTAGEAACAPLATPQPEPTTEVPPTEEEPTP